MQQKHFETQRFIIFCLNCERTEAVLDLLHTEELYKKIIIIMDRSKNFIHRY